MTSMSEVRHIEVPTQTREAQIVPTTWRDDDSTVELVWTTGARRRAYDWMSDQLFDEELQVDEQSVDMARFEAGTVQVLDGHRAGGTDNILGVAERGWIEKGQGRARIKLRTSTPELAAIAADVKAGLIRAVSFGYSVQRYEVTPAQQRADGVNVPLYRAIRWQPQEISFVAVPADPVAGTRSQQSVSHPCEIVVRADAQHQEPLAMTHQVQDPAPVAQPDAAAAETQRAAEFAQRAADITELCARHGLATLAAGLIRSQSSVEQARAAVLDELARRDAAQGGHLNVRSVQTVRDEAQTRMAGIEQAIQHRLDARVKLDDNGRQYRGLSLLEIGRDFLASRGVETRGMDRMRVATEMLHFRSGMSHTTSDFSSLMSNVANKRLRSAYDENPGTYAMWARRAPNAPDFKSIQVTQLSGAPSLLQTNEHGEFTYGTMKDGAETYSVVTYGRIVSLTRQAIVNDDLRAFDRLVAAFGNSARRLENATVYGILTANAALADAVALFSAVSGARTQSNVSTGAGSALQASALATARTAMRRMNGMNGEPLNIAPAYLIVPATLEQTAYQLTSSSYVPATTSAINEFRAGGRTALEPIVEPLLDAASTANWYLAANSAQIDTVEYCYLDGAEGPVIEQDVGFEVDGVSFKCRLDFGAKAVDYRGLHRGAGS
jgi:hypothetical protein